MKFEVISSELLLTGYRLAGKGLIPKDFSLFNFSLLICSCSAWIPNAIKNWKKPENDYLEAKFKVDISDDYFLKFIVMDSLGNGQADLMKKIK